MANFSFFADRAQQPSPRDVLRVLGRAAPAWHDLETHLAQTCGLKGSLHFMYGARYGWALRFRRGGRAFLAMYPNRGCFTVQIILGSAQVAAAGAIGLPPGISEVLEAAKTYPEGRWLFIPVKSLKAARQLRALIALKLPRRKDS